jgi:hypothetical protein
MDIRLRLYDKHDMARPTVGFVENYRVEPDNKKPGEWVLLAEHLKWLNYVYSVSIYLYRLISPPDQFAKMQAQLLYLAHCTDNALGRKG